VINFTNIAAGRLLKLELKISLCSGFIVKAVLVLNFWNFVWMILVLLWNCGQKFKTKRTIPITIYHAHTAVRNEF